MTSKPDRYVSFEGTDCNADADRLIEMLEGHLAAAEGDERWRRYLREKRSLQAKLSQDNLHFIGAQMNSLHEYLEECGDSPALELLHRIEIDYC